MLYVFLVLYKYLEGPISIRGRKTKRIKKKKGEDIKTFRKYWEEDFR